MLPFGTSHNLKPGSLSRSNKGFAGELKRRQVGDSNYISTSRGVENNVQRVEQTIVGEHLELLLEVVGSVQQLHLCIELTGIGVQQHLDLIHRCIEVHRMNGTSFNVTSLVRRQKICTLSSQTGLGIRRCGVKRKIPGASVVDIDCGGLVPSADKGLNWTQESVLGVCLDLHGGPVGSDPQFNEGLNGAPI